MKKIVFSLSILSLLLVQACAPSPKLVKLEADNKVIEEATVVGKLFSEAFVKNDFETAANLYSDSSLKEFRDAMKILDQLGSGTRDMIYAQFFGPGVGVDSVVKMSDREYFAKFIGSVMNRATEISGMKIDSIQIVGGVAEGDSVVYLLTKSHVSIGGKSTATIEVQTFTREKEGFKATVSEEMKQIANTFESLLHQQQALEQIQENQMMNSYEMNQSTEGSAGVIGTDDSEGSDSSRGSGSSEGSSEKAATEQKTTQDVDSQSGDTATGATLE